MSSSVVIREGFSFFRSRASAPSVADVAAASLDHIFVIAGPSGSGKSTFMREFVEDRLPKEVSDDLPLAAKDWERTSGNELTRKGLSAVVRRKGATSGLVVHYDIMRAHTRGFEHYANDPAMQAVTGAKAALTVLTILPPREALFEQFLARARSGDYEEWWDKREVGRRLRRKLRAGLFKLLGKQPRILKEGHLALLCVYASDARLNQWTSRWESFLDGVRRERDDVRLVYIAPDSVQNEHPRFRLLRRA